VEVEAFRALRAQVVTRLEDAPASKIILVTSAEAGEGRSTVAVNLARVLASHGQRVLLFDAELRRPRMKALLADPHGLGLEEVLRGSLGPGGGAAEPDPGGRRAGADEALLDGADLRGSPLPETLQAASGSYDAVVIDSAPVKHVLRIRPDRPPGRRHPARDPPGATRRDSANRALKKLADLKVKVLGAVANSAPGPPSPPVGGSPRDPVREAERIAQEGDEVVVLE